MTGGRREIRAHLAAALDDAWAIESRPIDEVRAALSDLGIDPTASIRLAQQLASAGAHDPAARLLSKMEHAEAVDAEISALEEADIDDIKAALPAETDGSRCSDRSSTAKIVPIEPNQRRLSALGWGSSLIGIAASVLLFIAVRPDQLEQADIEPFSMEAPAPLALETESADAPQQNPLPELSQLQGNASAGRDQYGIGQADLADAFRETPANAADRRDLRSLDDEAEQPPAESRKVRAGLENKLDLSSAVTTSDTKAHQSPPRPKARLDLSDGERAEIAAASPQDPPIPALRPGVEEDVSAQTSVAASRLPPRLTVAADAARPQKPQAEPDLLLTILADLRAVLLIDEAGAPASLRALSNRLPGDRLAAKLGLAEQRAAGGRIIALIAFARDDEIVDAVLVERTTVQTVLDPAAQTVTGLSGFVGAESLALSHSETSIELIELTAGR